MPRSDAIKTDATANETLADTESSDGVAGTPDSGVADLAGQRSGSDASQDGKSPSSRSSSGCGCSVYAHTRGQLANLIGLAILAIGLRVRTARWLAQRALRRDLPGDPQR
jgi:hypothetical protein